MESVYIFDKKIEKDVIKILKDDEFMRVSYINRESDTLRNGKECHILYINANEEETGSIEEKFKELGVDKITGAEEKEIIGTIKAEEESAASGMGMIFG